MKIDEAIEVLKNYVEKSKEWHMISNYKKENGIRDEAIETLISTVEMVRESLKEVKGAKTCQFITSIKTYDVMADKGYTVARKHNNLIKQLKAELEVENG